MAYELHGMLTGAVSMTTGDTVEPAYGGSHESFLSNVVTPIYEVIRKEAEKNKCGTADHTTWRNYDDLNEFFWSPDCFQIGWPMRLEHDFFCTSSPKKSKVKTSRSAREQRKEKETEDEEQGLNDVTSEENREPKWLGKTNFVEIRSFWQVFRSFDRMWSFFILSLQAMIIMACHDVGSPLEVFDAVILEDVMSIFITSAILKLIQVYLITNAVDLVLFFVPAVSKYIEISNWSICRTISRWTQPRLYVGRGMQETQISLFKYTFFWMLVLSTKLVFSYSFEIKPLIAPTREIMKIGVQTYDWHELFPKVRSNVGAIVAVWAPIIVVYFMDTQIWYSVYCTVCGGLYGILHHLGEVSKSEVLDQKFVLVWNQIISNFRSEDLISNREMDLMTIPTSGLFPEFIRWPIFLLANKVWVVSNIVNEIERSIEESTFLQDFKMSALPALQNKFVELLELIVEGDKNQNGKVVQVLQDIFELVTNDMMANGHRVVDLIECSQEAVDDFTFFSRKREPQLFESAASKTSICFPLPDDGPLTEQIQRLHLLLTVKDKAMDMPANLEARRRISFFATSLFMDMPSAPEVCSMMSFSVMTPHYMEDVNFSMKELQSSKGQVSIIFYMQKIFPDEWKNFLERMGYQNFNELIDDEKEEEIRKWASFRGQTLSRTVRGIMYYRQALKLQALLEMPEYKAFIALIFFLVATCAYPDVVQDVNVFERNNPKSSAELDALVDMKFTYVVSCQMFGSHKSSGDPRAEDVKDLMIRYPALRVAYIEEKEEIIGDKPQKVYSSILAKAVGTFDQVIYRIKLPGPPIIGEGKPENQNHAIIFTRGEALQTIDMNQDNYLEEALKVRNLLQEFHHNRGRRPPTILGLREHIFTGSVSSLAWFMSYQETSFVTIGQRLLANPLRVRFHYGHPDVFDRLFHMTRGGISKASKTINLSEDVFAGFNSTLRRGCITYHEYLQVGKGRDVGLNQISKFEAKVANGNSEQTLSRDIHRLGRRFDFFRMLSCYFTTIGFYFSSLISVLGIYVFLYGQLYLVLSGLEKALLIEARMKNIESLETALASQSFIQLGLLTGLPMVMEIGLEKGFLTALKDFVLMQLQLAAVFFTFSLGTKTHHFGRTIMYGGAKYIPTGRKVVVFHASFTENYRLYSRSHFVKGFELLLLLVVYDLFRRSYQSSMAYVLITYSVWFMTMTWLFAPFFFNPSGFDWDKIVDDWKGWNKWIKEKGGIGIQQNKSWQSWWNDEQAHLRRSGYGARLFEILLSIRFFLYQYGLVYHLDISQQSKNFLVYVLSWVVILAVFLTVKAVNIGRQLFSARYHLMFRFFKAFLFLSVFTIVITLSVICELSSKDLLVCCLAFLPTGWGLILVAQAVRPIIENTGLWQFTEVLAKAYDYGMGSILFSPIAILAWLPIISAFQTRFLFNQAFNRHLQIQPILEGKKKQK
ncbi:Putative callose synthase 8 [Gossypium arboreum]|uniref:1,3-beta-glucan synthase n=1 Tax=Gossypium arboreum TaxID=29729 RepID=A0A0B0NB73_GOSAR|nr:Putative callose synthase 8 [Gossypium arboreum]